MTKLWLIVLLAFVAACSNEAVGNSIASWCKLQKNCTVNENP